MAGDAPEGHRSPLAYAAKTDEAPGSAAKIIMDPAGFILDFDRGAERLLGYPRSEVLGKRVSDVVVPARLRAAHEAGLRRYRDTATAPLLETRMELPALRRDGTEITVELSISRVTHRGREAFAGRLQELAHPGAVQGELRLHADFHRALLDNAPIIVAVVDSTGVPTWVSSSGQGLFAPPSEGERTVEALLSGLVHPADLERARAALRQGAVNGVDEPVEMRVRGDDGAWRAISLQARNLLDHPAVHGTAFYATDVTRLHAAQRQTRVEAARLMTLIESLNVAVLLQDERRRVVLANAAFVDMFSLGVAPARLAGTSVRSSSPFAGLFADAEEVERRTEEATRRGRPLRGEEISLVDGRVLERDYVPITLDGTTLGHLWVFRDVTAQAEIRRGLQERARILSELAGLKTEFVSVVSHELRTPLTSINTFASMLEEADDLSESERTAAVAAIRRNADRMLNLVADLILLAKLESGELSLEYGPVDVARLVREAADAIEGSTVGVRTEITDGPPLAGDEGLLGQLVDTAVGVVTASSVAGAEVEVRACTADGGWHLTVTTSAADGTTAERLLSTRLPHPDATAESRTGALAVMLARAIATRHGGQLSMSIEPPRAWLTVDLPSPADPPSDS